MKVWAVWSTLRPKYWLSACALTTVALCLTAAANERTEQSTEEHADVPEESRQQQVDTDLLALLAETMTTDHDLDRFEAEVWLTATDQRMRKHIENSAQRLRLLRLVFRESQVHGLDPDLVLGLMQVESYFDRFAISTAGAQGLMQVMPFWRIEIGRPQDNLTDVETNIRYGTTILAHYIDRAGGDLVDALGRYNGSRGKLWYPERVLTAWRRDWRNKAWSELPELRQSCSKYPLKACLYQ